MAAMRRVSNRLADRDKRLRHATIGILSRILRFDPYEAAIRVLYVLHESVS